jgi:uncharacterized membrane protein YdfJ with MMPL/SSD domain
MEFIYRNRWLLITVWVAAVLVLTADGVLP